MIRRVFASRTELARAAAAEAAEHIVAAISKRGAARVTFATGVSQLDFLRELTHWPGIDWSAVEIFHLDEYIGLPADHPASFQRFIRERIMEPAGITRAHLLDGTAENSAAAGAAISEAAVDLTIVGIGENGHLAFNDPPADFETEEPFIVVKLDERSRRQQVNEGWFASVEETPPAAITMSIRQILKSRAILCIVPEARKAEAVARCFEGEIGPLAPASVLRLHPDAAAYLDRDSASLLTAK